jgi:hypothetical protein
MILWGLRRLNTILAITLLTAACSNSGQRPGSLASATQVERPAYAGVALPDGAEVDEPGSLVFANRTGWSGRIILKTSALRAATEAQVESLLARSGRRPVFRSMTGDTVMVFLDSSGTGVTHVRIWDRFGGVGVEIISDLPREPLPTAGNP